MPFKLDYLLPVLTPFVCFVQALYPLSSWIDRLASLVEHVLHHIRQHDSFMGIPTDIEDMIAAFDRFRHTPEAIMELNSLSGSSDYFTQEKIYARFGEKVLNVSFLSL